MSRVSCKEDVAEERCFLPDKRKASLRQDVWDPAAPCIRSGRGGSEVVVAAVRWWWWWGGGWGVEREPAVRFSREETWPSLIKIAHPAVF